MALQQSIIVDHNFFAACLPTGRLGALPAEGRLCEKKKKKIRRGGIGFKAT
jgi:hypothetical protein